MCQKNFWIFWREGVDFILWFIDSHMPFVVREAVFVLSLQL